MIAGRPLTLWLSLVTLLSGAVATTAIALGADPVTVGTLLPPWMAVIGGVLAFVANQQPTLAPGDSYTIQTPKGQPNYEATVASPPAATKPVVAAE